MDWYMDGWIFLPRGDTFQSVYIIIHVCMRPITFYQDVNASLEFVVVFADLKRAQRQYDMAERCLRDGIKMSLYLYPNDHPRVAQVYTWLDRYVCMHVHT